MGISWDIYKYEQSDIWVRLMAPPNEENDDCLWNLGIPLVFLRQTHIFHVDETVRF